MLEIRTNCEHCDKNLPTDSEEARICTFECTFCSDCVDGFLENVCPNCGGSFEKRPVRPKEHLAKHPPRADKVLKPVDMIKFRKRLDKHRNIKGSES